jgi:hypothetical protein
MRSLDRVLTGPRRIDQGIAVYRGTISPARRRRPGTPCCDQAKDRQALRLCTRRSVRARRPFPASGGVIREGVHLSNPIRRLERVGRSRHAGTRSNEFKTNATLRMVAQLRGRSLQCPASRSGRSGGHADGSVPSWLRGRTPKSHPGCTKPSGRAFAKPWRRAGCRNCVLSRPRWVCPRVRFRVGAGANGFPSLSRASCAPGRFLPPCESTNATGPYT